MRECPEFVSAAGSVVAVTVDFGDTHIENVVAALQPRVDVPPRAVARVGFTAEAQSLQNVVLEPLHRNDQPVADRENLKGTNGKSPNIVIWATLFFKRH